MTGARTAAPHGKRILVVDDSEVIQDVLRDFLGPDYTVEAVGDAASALKAITKNKPDAILLDVKLPGVDGLSLLKSLRGRGMQAPVFVMTGYDSKGLAIEAMQRGANGYLPKPFDLLHLKEVLVDAVG